MVYRVFNIASLISVMLLLVTVGLSLATFGVNPWDHRMSLGDRLHVGVWRGYRGATLGCLVLFNDADYGPYRGSIIQLSDEDGNLFPTLDRKVAWGDSHGVYYRYFRWPEGTTLWTLMISLWYPMLLFAVIPGAWLWRRWRFRRDR